MLGKPMILYVVEVAQKIAGDNIIVIIGHQADKVKDTVNAKYQAIFAKQEEQLGTGHAVSCAVPHIPKEVGHVVILCGDVPMISSQTLHDLIAEHLRLQRDITVLAVNMDDPAGYGRVLFDGNGDLAAIVEEPDASHEQKRIRSVNSGIYCINNNCLSELLNEIKADNAQGEFYLTDIIQIGRKHNKNMGAVVGPDYREVMGINTVKQLNKAENMMRTKFAKKS
jgi:bifunctional UDP-N-acetylglucosamine pyrophosphorylase/glucosamine-1-phosphate N-acetyltransferase/UDP-N-acetylglucosamine pyrophosphorylase